MKTISVLDNEEIKRWIFDLGIDDPLFFYDYLMVLESQENWTFDDDSECYNRFSMLADALAQMIDDRSSKREPVVKDLTQFLRILAYRNISASFRLLSILHRIQPSLTVRLLELCKTEQVKDIQPEAMLFLTRMQILLKAECLRRIFGKQRRTKIIQLLQEMKG